MISFNSTNISQQSNRGIFINQHITVQSAAELTGYNIKYLRRRCSSTLPSGTLKRLVICLLTEVAF
jgi:hypothetical protein